MFGVMVIMGAVLGLFFLLMGWLLLPLLRQRMKKRATAFRAHQAGDIGGGFRQARSGHDSRHKEVFEGEYVLHPEGKRWTGKERTRAGDTRVEAGDAGLQE